MSIGLTRRSLLRVGVLSPLIIPGRSLARIGSGGVAAVVASPCGSPIPITSSAQITGPGCYSVVGTMPNLSFNGLSNVTILGNNQTVSGSIAIDATGQSGIVIRDLHCLSATFTGNSSSAQTPTPVIYINNFSTADFPLGCRVYGSNITFDSCHLGGSGLDDNILTLNVSLTPPDDKNHYLTINNCTFGATTDVTIEGVGGWDHVTITNCIIPGGPFGGIGGWYGPAGNGSPYAFVVTNCVFTGNTIPTGTAGQWDFLDGSGGLTSRIGDAAATAQWGPGVSNTYAANNIFSGNIYV